MLDIECFELCDYFKWCGVEWVDDFLNDNEDFDCVCICCVFEVLKDVGILFENFVVVVENMR